MVLPFALLIRVGLYAFAAGAGGWTSVALGLLAVTVLLSGYAWLVGRRFGAGPTMRAFLRRGAVAVGALYVGYALTFVAGGNVSTPEVRAEYRELHPLLRVAASTVFLADGGRVMTDASRTPEDYWLMGLPVNEASLHFPQETGYVHALDLRTRGRKEWSNRLVEGFFWVMGFHALRHVGTADHLHVSLRIPEG